MKIHIANKSASTYILYFSLNVYFLFLGWQIIAAMPENSQKMSKVSNLDGTAIKSRLLVVGNEGEGLSASIIDKCNVFESISPGRKLHPCVDSLNVSVATALLMERLLKR